MRRYVRNVASIFGTMNWPVNIQKAGRNKYITRNIDVNGYKPTFRYAIRCRNLRREVAKNALFFEKKISTEPVAHRRTWCNRSVKLMGADPRNASRFVMQ